MFAKNNNKEEGWELRSVDRELAFCKLVVDRVPSGVIRETRDLNSQ
jgi:hypothetical protein